MSTVIAGILLVLSMNEVVTTTPIVHTKYGDIMGSEISTTVGDRTYNVKQFLGIPYAKPPLGSLRFRKPEPVTEITSPFNATSYGYICPQITVPMEPTYGTEDEDCLFLNVFVPDQLADKPSGHAVMVWIYGGAFILGSSDTYDGTALVSVGNVILVTINYRLGPFGFFSTMDENSPGNMGLWDQRLALHWIKDNIAAFGGDADRITVFGESAGAISSALHGMFPDDNPPFHRIIAESGSPSIGSMNCSRNTMHQVRKIAEALGCPHQSDTASIVECLRTIPWRTYLETVNALSNNYEDYEVVLFDPVVDGEFIKRDPRSISRLPNKEELDEIKQLGKFDFLNGFNAYEGGTYLPYFTEGQDLETFLPSSEDFERLLDGAMMLVYGRTFPKSIMDLVRYEYTNWTGPYDPRNIRLQFEKVFADTGFAVPAVEFSRYHLSTKTDKNTFMYKFMPETSNKISYTASWIPGADHGEELYILMEFKDQKKLTDWEKELALQMQRYWTNFAKTGNPNEPATDGLTYWQEYTPETQSYIELDKNMSNDSVKQFLYAREIEFWLDVFPDLIDRLDIQGEGTEPESKDQGVDSQFHEEL